MLSIILDLRCSPHQPSPDMVVRTLAGLVAGVVQTLVRDVTMIACERHDFIDAIADEAGCDILIAEHNVLTAAIQKAREDHILILQAGALIDADVLDEAREEIESGLAHRSLIMRARPHNFITRLYPDWCRAVGILAHRRNLLACVGKDERLSALMRHVPHRATFASHLRIMR
jgi:hypothetical protein